jgi:hypothetical protein
MSEKNLWRASLLMSIVFLGILVGLWTERYNREKVFDAEMSDQLTSEAEVQHFLKEEWEAKSTWLNEPPIYVPTGIYVSSFRFLSANNVRATGYLWQRYKPELFGDKQGFLFPEAISNEIEEIHRQTIGDEELVIWHFESLFRQEFKYDDYPFDNKIVWIKIWANAWNRNIILTPDLASYQATGLTDIFGINESIVLGTWDRKDTYFNYHFRVYKTTFGNGSYQTERYFPTLYYNIVIKRKFINAFIINLIPLFVVAMLLFGLVMMVGEKKKELFGSSASGTIASCAALFFTVMLSHIRLREEFQSVGIVYIEYFYFMMYFVILLVTLNTYLFSEGCSSSCGFIPYKDNLLPKVAFWPLFFGSMVLITWFAF